MEENKRRLVFKYCRERGDIICLQETHSCLENEKIWSNEWGSKIFFAHGESNARGVCVMFVKSLNVKIVSTSVDLEGRILSIDFKVDSNIYNVTNVYAPNQNNISFFNNLNHILEDKSEKKIVIGDFNVTFDTELDRLNTPNNNDRNKEYLRNLMNEYLLEDIWRVRNPEKRHYTWLKRSNMNNPIKASRLDYALTSKGLDIENTTHVWAPDTDHRSVFLSVRNSDKTRGSGYWKMNTQLLNSKDFVDFMNKKISLDISSTSSMNPIEKWGYLKKAMIKNIQTYSRKKGSERKLIISQLAERVEELESNIPLPKHLEDILFHSKCELDALLKEDIQRVIFRSKAKWYQEGEKNSKYFYALEKARYNAKTCEVLIDEKTGQEISNEKEIMKLQFQFYEQLYKSDDGILF